MFFKYLQWCCSAWVFFLLGLPPAEAAAASANIEATLIIQPHSCAYESTEKNCKTELLIRWRSNLRSSYCLFEKPMEDTGSQQAIGSEKKVICWEKRSRARLYLDFESEVSRTYILKHQSQTVAEYKVVVAKITRRLNRRRRRPWNF